MKANPDFTPRVFLVDGNRILHERNAGIVCFVGMRTKLPLIGVGKIFYHVDGLTKDNIKGGVKKVLHDLNIFSEQFEGYDNLDDPALGKKLIHISRKCIEPVDHNHAKKVKETDGEKKSYTSSFAIASRLKARAIKFGVPHY